MHSVFIIIAFIALVLYLISYILASLSVVVRKFWKKISFTSFETAWLMFFIGVFVPPPSSDMSGILEFGILVIFLIINFFWFIPLVYYYELRIKQSLTPYFYGLIVIMIAISGISLGGWYGVFLEDLWLPLSDVIRLLTMGFALLYSGFLVYHSGSSSTQAVRFEYYSLFGVGLSAFGHGIFHIFVRGFGMLHELPDIISAPESLEVYLVILVEFTAFALGAIGFIFLLINTIKNSDYRPVSGQTGVKS